MLRLVDRTQDKNECLKEVLEIVPKVNFFCCPLRDRICLAFKPKLEISH